MTEEQITINIEIIELISKVFDVKEEGYRLMLLSSVKKPDHIEMNYSFDKELHFLNYRVLVPNDHLELPSITKIYWGAFTYENEIHDLFGIKFKGINIDFKGHFYNTRVKTPFNCAEPEKAVPVKAEAKQE